MLRATAALHKSKFQGLSNNASRVWSRSHLPHNAVWSFIAISMPRHKSLGSFQLCPVLNNYIYENETLPLLRLDYDLVLC